MKPEFKKVNRQNRTYKFPDMDLRVEGVVSINVSERGTHRLNLENGKKYIVPSGWRGIEFDADEWTF